MFEDEKRQKDSLKKIREVKDENEDINLQLEEAQQHIKKLRAEAGMLLEEIEDLKQNDTGPSNYKLTLLKAQLVKRRDLMPKHPHNVFFAYCRHERLRIKKQAHDTSYNVATRILAHRWKVLNKQDRQIYHEIYKKELDDYDSAMRKYHTESEDQGENTQSEKSQKKQCENQEAQNKQEKQQKKQNEEQEKHQEHDKGQEKDQAHS